MDEELAGRVRQYRTERGWTQRELAAEADVSPSEVGKIEAAFKSPGLGVLSKIARAFDVEAEEFQELLNPASELPVYLRRRYLRRRYGLPGEATAEVEAYFKQLQAKYGTTN